MDSHPPPALDRDLLELYLNDHLTGATAGRARIRHMVQEYADLPICRSTTRYANWPTTWRRSTSASPA